MISSGTEIACHAKGAHFIYGPEVRTVLDIGGQDIKASRSIWICVLPKKGKNPDQRSGLVGLGAAIHGGE